MAEASIYLDRIDVCRYWPPGAPLTCPEFMARLQAGREDSRDYPFLTPGQLQAFKLALKARNYLPTVELITLPQAVDPGVIPLNEPDENAPVLVSGNNALTFEVLGTLWAQGLTPAYFLLIDCAGNTVDMALVFEVFTPARLATALTGSGLAGMVKHRHLIVPGLTAPLAPDFAAATGWEIEVGPVCAAELPLFLGNRWRPVT